MVHDGYVKEGPFAIAKQKDTVQAEEIFFETCGNMCQCPSSAIAGVQTVGKTTGFPFEVKEANKAVQD